MQPKQIFLVFLLMLLALALLVGACSVVLGPTSESPTPTVVVTEVPGPGTVIKGLAPVEDVEVQILESMPIQVAVRVQGNLSDACTSLDQTVVIREGNTFKLQITTTRPGDAVCAQVLQPFEIEQELDVVGLPAGVYTVEVNGVSEQFTLAVDNVLEPTATPIAVTPEVQQTDVTYVMAQEDVSIYSGPGAEYNTIGFVAGGQTAKVTGVSTDENWWRVICPDDSVGSCWVSADPSLTQPTAAPVVVNPTPQPTSQPTPQPTAAPLVCDQAELVSNLTIRDYAPFSPRMDFTKTWRIKNTGSCTWTTGYALVNASGDAMTDRLVQSLSKTVNPGESVDLSIKMTAPRMDGIYQGSWMLRNADGKQFGVGERGTQALWARIQVITPNPDYLYDFAANYCAAEWQSSAGDLGCPGNTQSEKGSVTLLLDPRLENRREDEPTLWLRPHATQDGWITGTFPAMTVKKDSYFKAWVGCLANSEGCDVTFRLDYLTQRGVVKNLGEWQEVSDGKVTVIEEDLSELVGKSVQFILSVEVNNKKYAAANAFWFAPSLQIVQPAPDSASALQAARGSLASHFNVNPERVEVLQVSQPLIWSDTCLGIQRDESNCAPATIPGFSFHLRLAESTFEARTDLTGTLLSWMEIV